jgi:phage-related protein
VPRTPIVIYCEEDGTAPFIQWLVDLPNRAQDKVRIRMRRLSELGHELRRPEADYLRDGIYELRASVRGVNYRVLYFFHGRIAAIITHGIVKEDRVPPVEIDAAVRRKVKFERKPSLHTLEGA